MRIAHLKVELKGPERFVFGIWDATAGCYVEEAEWIVVVADDRQMTAVRLQGAIEYFLSQQCVGVSSDVQQVLTRFRVPLSRRWKVYQTK